MLRVVGYYTRTLTAPLHGVKRIATVLLLKIWEIPTKLLMWRLYQVETAVCLENQWTEPDC